MLKNRFFLIILFAFATSFVYSQEFTSLRFDFHTGARGLSDQNELFIEFIGEGPRVISTAVVRPPVRDGFVANRDHSVIIRNSPMAVVRQVYMIRFRVQRVGGGSMFDTWDLPSFKLSFNDATGRTFYEKPAGTWRFSDRENVWETMALPGFDPRGEKTKVTTWNLVLESGTDGLRQGNAASFLLTFADGGSKLFRIEPSNTTGRKIIPITFEAPGRSWRELKSISLATDSSSLLGFPYYAYPDSLFVTDDDWQLNRATISYSFSRNDAFNKVLTSFTGNRGRPGIVHQTLGKDYNLPTNIAGPRNYPAVKVLILRTLTGIDRSNPNPDIEVAFSHQGETIPHTVVSPTVPVPNNWNGGATWNSISSKASWARTACLPWTPSHIGELTALRLRLVNGRSVVGAGTPYSGTTASAVITGFIVLQQEFAHPIADYRAMWGSAADFSGWRVVAAEFGLNTNLTSRANSVTFPIRLRRG